MRSAPSRVLFCLAAVALVSIRPAAAQLVTPPESAPARSEPVVLPPDTAPITPGPSGAALPPRPPTIQSVQVREGLKWETLAKKDANNKIIRLSIPAEAAALANNPIINDKVREACQKVLKDRQAAFERVIIENLDIADELASDRVDKINIGDRGNDLKWLMAAIKPFTAPVSPGPLSSDLLKQNILDAEQAKVTQMIAKEYTEALRDELKNAIPGADKMSKAEIAMKMVPILIRTEALAEPMGVRRNLFIEAARALPSLLPKLDLPADARAKADAMLKSLSANASDDQRYDAMNTFKDTITVDQRRAILKAMIAARPK